ncbi:hypothetical protein BLNAU_19244 [Blattamonas nauphoetae]|uniref:Uncharacterized protein n=1 Tax=Blattamonas nauphoetae TaxID=2049346 RepID=A0ABQ9X386_9EUKA|nr:hypothetical protein BLNAU_19244 [Blattamonas nauphoetae]
MAPIKSKKEQNGFMSSFQFLHSLHQITPPDADRSARRSSSENTASSLASQDLFFEQVVVSSQPYIIHLLVNKRVERASSYLESTVQVATQMITPFHAHLPTFDFADRTGLMLHVVKQLANPRFASLSENVIDDILQSMQRWKRHGADEMKIARFFVQALCAEGFADLAEQFLHRKWVDAWNWSSRRESLMRFLGQNPRHQNMDWGIFW